MKIGYVGLGKLGMPVATAIQMKGHDVMGYDIDPARMTNDPVEYIEGDSRGVPGKFNREKQMYPIELGSLRHIVERSEIIFTAVQTPHKEEYEGHVPMPDTREDFGYEYLKDCMRAICVEAQAVKKYTIVSVVSTVLPTTMRRDIYPIIEEHGNWVRLVYNPSFIAMGTTMVDYLRPEFNLVGVNDQGAALLLEKFYKTITDAPTYLTTVENAELIKVAYNTFIGAKIVFANTLMEICHKLEGCDVDGVTDGLKLAKKRLISPAYLSGGMGDGGGCHPRDNIALSWLAKELDLSHDLFEDIMICREDQAKFLCDLVRDECRHYELTPFVLGKAFKANVGLTTGSPANLCAHYLDYPDSWDPYVDGGREEFPQAVYLVATRHDQFEHFEFPEGSVVIDPWRYIPYKSGIHVVHVGV